MGRKKGSGNRAETTASELVSCYFRLRPEVHDKFAELHQWYRDNQNAGRYLSREAALEMLIEEIHQRKMGGKKP